MGFGRDLGAALSMGLSATTKHKEAEKAHEKRNDAYQRRVTAFNEVLQKTAGSIQRLEGEYESARDVEVDVGLRALTEREGWASVVTEAGNLATWLVDGVAGRRGGVVAAGDAGA